MGWMSGFVVFEFFLIALSALCVNNPTNQENGWGTAYRNISATVYTYSYV